MTSDERLDREYWERRWTQVLRDHPGKIAGRRANAHLLTETADLHPGRALDAGCGHGAEAVWLASRGWRVTAVDYSVTALDLARSRATAIGADVAERIEWTEGDLTTWTPPPGSYDLVLSLYVHVQGSVGEMVRRLGAGVAPGGTLLLVGHRPIDPATGAPTRGCRPGAGLGRRRRRRSRPARMADRGRRGAATGRGRRGRRRGGARGLVRRGRLVRHSSRHRLRLRPSHGRRAYWDDVSRRPRRVRPAPSAITAASAPAIAFVWTQARQALQQTAAIGACSPYLAVARVTRPCQTVFIAAIVRPWRESGSRPVVGSSLEGCAGLV